VLSESLIAPGLRPVASTATVCAVAWAGQGNAMHRLVQSARDGCLIETTQEAVQGGVVRNRAEFESAPQFGVLRQSDLSFAVGPVLVAHQAKDGQ